MYVGVKEVQILDNYKLLITFKNSEKKIFDMSSYLGTGLYSELRNKQIFNSAHVSFDTIEWCNGVDICPEVLYNDGENIPQKNSKKEILCHI
jgi:hypothetical protein